MKSMKIGDNRIPIFKYCKILFKIVTLQTELDETHEKRVSE